MIKEKECAMRVLILLFFAVLICGCSLVVKQESGLKTYGISQENASDLIKKTEAQDPMGPVEIPAAKQEESAPPESLLK